MNHIIRALGSLTFAILLIASLAVILVVSTTVESMHGTPVAQKFIYTAGWFDFFLALIGLNIICSTLSRIPYKKYHTGFIVTHIGIILLLVGSMISRLWGVEGQMALYEQESTDVLRQTTYQLVVHTGHHETYAFDLKSLPKNSQRKLRISGLDLSIQKVWENAVLRQDIKEGTAQDAANPAVKLSLQSETLGFNDSLWLIDKNPLDPHSKQITLGMASIELKNSKPEKAKPEESVDAPILRIEQKNSGTFYRIDLTQDLEKDVPLGDTGLVATNMRYYPDARVEGNRLVNVSDQSLNPAVEFDVTNAAGQKERHTKFALFPEFESLHGKSSKNIFNLTIDFLVPSLVMQQKQKSGPSLIVFPINDRWGYQSQSSKGLTEGEFEIGKTYPTGWMDFTFRADEVLAHAVVDKKVEKAHEAEPGQMAVEVVISKDGKIMAQEWVLIQEPSRLDTADGPIVLSIKPKTFPVPFSLMLKDFRKVDYPGTKNASSFESDVLLEDRSAKKSIQQTISMNKPMDYKGYRIFQSSYIQDAQSGEASIFSVAKNPGITLIYTGSVVMFIGIVLVFYVKPLSSLYHKK